MEDIIVGPDNKTYYEISDPILRYSLASYCFTAAVIATVGNIVVLTACLKHKAIKLDRISVVLIRNIAIADLAYSLFVILQVGLSLVWNEWPYGNGHDALCHVSTFLQHALAFTDINLICALNISKLTCIIFPLYARLRTFKTGLVISAIVWLIAILYPMQAVDRGVYFDYRSYRCAYSFTPGMWEWLDPLNISLFLLLPTAIVFLTTICLLFYVKKVTGTNKQAILTMLPVSIVFCISYSPIGFYFVAEKWIRENAEPFLHEDLLYTSLYRYGMLVKFVNNSANPIIYFFTVQSFRDFVTKKLFRPSRTESTKRSVNKSSSKRRTYATSITNAKESRKSSSTV